MEKVSIIKVGGQVIDEEQKLIAFLSDFAALEGKKILVHGGGKVATDLASELGIATQMNEGRRITDSQMIKVVTMTYGGLINKKIVSALQGLDAPSIGLTGADGNLLRSKKRAPIDGVDYGWVGDIEEVNVPLLVSLIQNNLIPVVAPLTHDGNGQLLNTNADTIASVLAAALSQYFTVDLNYCFELKGVFKDVHDEGSIIRKLNRAEYESYREQGIVGEGMVPKLDNAFDAVDSGVSCVRVLSYENLANIQENNYDEFTYIH